MFFVKELLYSRYKIQEVLKHGHKKVGRFLKEIRKQNNMTQEQLGERIGVTNKTVSRWETGNYMPPIESLKLLSDIYPNKVSYDNIFPYFLRISSAITVALCTIFIIKSRGPTAVNVFRGYQG